MYVYWSKCYIITLSFFKSWNNGIVMLQGEKVWLLYGSRVADGRKAKGLKNCLILHVAFFGLPLVGQGVGKSRELEACDCTLAWILKTTPCMHWYLTYQRFIFNLQTQCEYFTHHKIVSPNFLVWKCFRKSTVSAKFWANRLKLCGNCTFLQKFDTRELDEIGVFYAVHIIFLSEFNKE